MPAVSMKSQGSLDCFVKADPIYTLYAWMERCGAVEFVILVLEMCDFVVAEIDGFIMETEDK